MFHTTAPCHNIYMQLLSPNDYKHPIIISTHSVCWLWKLTPVLSQFYGTVNWEKFGVKIFLLAQPTTKIKLTKIFRQWFIKTMRINLRYKNIMSHDMHRKTAILNALHLTRFTASPHSRCQFEVASSRRMVFRIPKNRCQHVCQPV